MLRQLFRVAAVHRPFSRAFYSTPLTLSEATPVDTTQQDPDPANTVPQQQATPSSSPASSPQSAATQQASPPDEIIQRTLDSDSPSPSDDHVPDSPPRGPSDPQPPPSSSSELVKRRFLHELPKESTYHLHVFASRNNTILTLTNSIGSPLSWVSSGSCGFKHQQRSLYEAGHQCAVRMFVKIQELKAQKDALMKLEILFRGFGQGREALYRALMTAEGDNIRDMVCRLSDTTPLKIGGGTRARKAKRL